jgi:hypothetical protein
VRLTWHTEVYEILGRNVLEWTALYDKKRTAEEIGKCWEKGFVKNLEVDYIGPGGLIVPVEINATLDSTKEGWQILTLCRDISDRKKYMAEKKEAGGAALSVPENGVDRKARRGDRA